MTDLQVSNEVGAHTHLQGIICAKDWKLTLDAMEIAGFRFGRPKFKANPHGTFRWPEVEVLGKDLVLAQMLVADSLGEKGIFQINIGRQVKRMPPNVLKFIIIQRIDVLKDPRRVGPH